MDLNKKLDENSTLYSSERGGGKFCLSTICISTNNIANCEPFYLKKINEQLVGLFNNYGMVLLKESSEADAVNSLNKLKDIFGNPVMHNMSDEHGFHPVEYREGFPEYANLTRNDVDFHTDGSFEKNKPKVLVLRCEKQSVVGGASKILDGSLLYDHLNLMAPDKILPLFDDNALTVKRGDRYSSTAIFKERGSRIELVFRKGHDIEIILNEAAKDGYRLICEYLENAKEYFQYMLNPCETLILDNTRVLHGRTAFGAQVNRKLLGLWLDGKSEEKLKFGIVVPPVTHNNH